MIMPNPFRHDKQFILSPHALLSGDNRLRADLPSASVVRRGRGSASLMKAVPQMFFCYDYVPSIIRSSARE